MPKLEISAQLYFADWCGHCHHFIPEWDKFAEQIEKNPGPNKVVTKKYEEGSIPKDEKPTINGKEIRGYPTVKITVMSDKGKKVEYEYNGKRNSKALMEHVNKMAVKNLE